MPSVTIKQLIASLAVLAYLFITYLLIFHLKNPLLRTQHETLVFLSVISSLYLIPVIFFGITMGILFTVALTLLITIVLIIEVAVTGHFFFMVVPLICCVFILMVNWADKKKQAILLTYEVEVEKNVAMKNEMEFKLKEKSEAVNSYFDRYSRFYNLRRVAEDFAISLNLEKLGDVIIERCLGFVRKGDHCLLYILGEDVGTLFLIASKSLSDKEKPKNKQGDVFDIWVVKNRQHLVVPDISSDFRFDITKESLESFQGLIISPLLSQGRVIGVLRINSKEKNVLTTEDLRLLDLISGLTASALANALLYQKTEELAIRDSLTSLYVQRYFKERLKEEHKRVLLSHSTISLIMCDLDNFKLYNDQYGHGAGDLVLKGLAGILVNEVGEDGIVARYGGEEFAILLPNVNKLEARLLTDKLKQAIEQKQFLLRNEVTHITASFGISNLPQDTLEQEELIRIADERLYKSKRAGKNQICSEES